MALFAVYSFRNKSRLRLISFFKVFKISCKLWKCKKEFRKYFWISKKLHLNMLRWTLAFTETQYLSLGVNTLTNSLKSSDTTKEEFFELLFFQSDQKIWQKYCCEALSSVSDPLTCWLSISVLTWGFLGI